jgi:hypothetical protein
MARGQALVCIAAATMAALVVLGSTFAAGEDDAAALVGQLPTNGAFSNVELEKRIAALGAAALPALEQELRLGIRFRALDEHLKAHGSRRSAVASALARIPGDASTDLLVRALSDPPDNYGMTLQPPLRRVCAPMISKIRARRTVRAGTFQCIDGHL